MSSSVHGLRGRKCVVGHISAGIGQFLLSVLEQVGSSISVVGSVSAESYTEAEVGGYIGAVGLNTEPVGWCIQAPFGEMWDGIETAVGTGTVQVAVWAGFAA